MFLCSVLSPPSGHCSARQAQYIYLYLDLRSQQGIYQEHHETSIEAFNRVFEGDAHTFH